MLQTTPLGKLFGTSEVVLSEQITKSFYLSLWKEAVKMSPKFGAMSFNLLITYYIRIVADRGRLSCSVIIMLLKNKCCNFL